MFIYMIMCHKNAKQVMRLAKRLKTDESDVMIHADSEMPDCRLLFDFADKNGIYYTKKRIHGQLNTRSLVDIPMIMIDEIEEIQRREGKIYLYYALLSGQDYPIKPIHEINQELRRAYPIPLIDCTPYHESNWISKKFLINKKMVQQWNKISSMPAGIRRKLYRLLYYAIHFFDHYYMIRKRKTTKDLLDGIDLYGGSEWWVLPNKTISFISREYHSNLPHVKAILDESLTPDETFFQIETMRSEQKNLVVINPIDQREQNCKTWAYFSDENTPFMGHPYIITEDEYDKIANTECWFARKFDETESSIVLDMIDKRILDCHDSCIAGKA